LSRSCQQQTLRSIEDAMTRISMGTSVLFLLWMAALTAQQQPTPTTEPAHKVYVLTGCLEADVAKSSFRLTGGSAVGQAPPARRSSASPAETTGVYLLQPVSSIGEQGISRERLQGHVGARVEVTVRPVETLPSTPSSTSSTSRDPKDKPQDPAPPRYTVIKIGRLADSCA
jgi:hypothetical protein